MLPLIIGAVLVVGGIAYINGSGGFSKIGEGFNRLTKTQAGKNLEVQQAAYEHDKSKRGFFENGYAFFFGETALSNLNQPGTSKPASTQLGTRKASAYSNRLKVIDG